MTEISGYYKFIVAESGVCNWSTVVCVLFNMISILAQLPPYASVIGLCSPMRPFRYARAPRRRDFRALNVCLVTKGTNSKVSSDLLMSPLLDSCIAIWIGTADFLMIDYALVQTVLNSTHIWERLDEVDDRIRFFVVLDNGLGNELRDSLPSFVELTVVPDTFVTKKAKYKARALEYLRQSQQLTQDDWVLHLDEESMIDEAVIKSCVDFIERGNEDIGMGTIHYNTVNHWTNPFLSAAEVVRVAEDFSRFQLPVRLFRRPLLGWMHGSWILINGEVENRVTWETGCVA